MLKIATAKMPAAKRNVLLESLREVTPPILRRAAGSETVISPVTAQGRLRIPD